MAAISYDEDEQRSIFAGDIKAYIERNIPKDCFDAMDTIGNGATELLSEYLRWRFRTIRPRTRTVHLSHALAKEMRSGSMRSDRLGGLIQKLRVGEDVRTIANCNIGASQSRIGTATQRRLEFLLDKFRVSHFVLSEPGLAPDIALAAVNESEVFVIGFFDDYANDVSIAESLIKSFPDCPFVSRITNTSARTLALSSDERDAMLRFGIDPSALIAIDEYIYLIGAGSDSTNALLETNATLGAFKILEAAIAVAKCMTRPQEDTLESCDDIYSRFVFVSSDRFAVRNLSTGLEYALPF